MIHGILQFTLPIALCCVLHRCGSQEIHCTVLLSVSLLGVLDAQGTHTQVDSEDDCCECSIAAAGLHSQRVLVGHS